LLEDEIGKPVVTSSVAYSWYSMKLIDIEAVCWLRQFDGKFGSVREPLGSARECRQNEFAASF
jgi:hypothetical protein